MGRKEFKTEEEKKEKGDAKNIEKKKKKDERENVCIRILWMEWMDGWNGQAAKETTKRKPASQPASVLLYPHPPNVFGYELFRYFVE